MYLPKINSFYKYLWCFLGRSQCVSSSELLRSEQEEEEEKDKDKHYVIEITFDEVDDDVDCIVDDEE